MSLNGTSFSISALGYEWSAAGKVLAWHLDEVSTTEKKEGRDTTIFKPFLFLILKNSISMYVKWPNYEHRKEISMNTFLSGKPNS